MKRFSSWRDALADAGGRGAACAEVAVPLRARHGHDGHLIRNRAAHGGQEGAGSRGWIWREDDVTEHRRRVANGQTGAVGVAFIGAIKGRHRTGDPVAEHKGHIGVIGVFTAGADNAT